MTDCKYKENLKKLLSFYPHIYYKGDDINVNCIQNYAKYIRFFYVSEGDFINKFVSYECGIKEILYINISLDELDVVIEQFKRDEKLKEVIEIINE